MRNEAEEVRFLNEVGNIVVKINPYVNPGPAFRLVKEGMSKGAEVYGDNAFVERDNCREAIEEARDGIAYAMMEALKDSLKLDDRELAVEKRMELQAAAAHLLIADWHFRRAYNKQFE